jgi:hypothetical protein
MDPIIVDMIRHEINSVKTDVKEIREDVKQLLKFKWQIVGGSMLASLILTVLLQVYFK